MAYNLNVETFVEYGIGMSFLALRIYARWRYFRGFQLDDILTVLAMIFWTLVCVIIFYLQKLGSNIADRKTVEAFPDSQIPNLVIGSKLAFTNWIWYLSYIWCLKGVLLCLYHKMTEGTFRHRTVHLASAFCILTYVACMLTHICCCIPLTRNWQIKPYPGENCTLRKPNYVVIAVLNVLSDIVIMIVPIPILINLHIPTPRKLILILLFSSGIFVMICTILRAYYSLKSIETLTTALGWADRECFVAAIVASLPGIKPLFRNVSWLGSSVGRSSGKPSYGAGGSGPGGAGGGGGGGGMGRGFGKLGGGTGSSKTYLPSRDADKFELIERQERLGRRDSVDTGSCVDGDPGPGITVTREYILEHDRVSAGRG